MYLLNIIQAGIKPLEEKTSHLQDYEIDFECQERNRIDSLSYTPKPDFLLS